VPLVASDPDEQKAGQCHHDRQGEEETDSGVERPLREERVELADPLDGEPQREDGEADPEIRSHSSEREGEPGAPRYTYPSSRALRPGQGPSPTRRAVSATEMCAAASRLTSPRSPPGRGGGNPTGAVHTGEANVGR